MDITNIGAYTDFITSQNATTSKLQDDLKNKDYANAKEDELLSACKQFESYLLEQVFKEMEKSVDVLKSDNDSDPNKNLLDYFGDSTIQKLAADSTETQGLGIAQMLYEQMKRNYGITDIPTEGTSENK